MAINVLHLSDTTLSGSPIRIVDLINKHSSRYQARHIVWNATTGFRTFKTDLVGSDMADERIAEHLRLADVIHYHNRWARQEIFRRFKMPNKPSVIQIHSPRKGYEPFGAEARSGVPIAIIAQFHAREWPEASYLVPNVVDVTDAIYDRPSIPLRTMPVVSYAPSNYNAKGWDDKGYGAIMPVLKRLKFQNKIYLQLITQKTHSETMELKRGADIGIDEVVTGSYHLSSLEYLAMGVPCFANLDKQTIDAVRRVSGCEGKLPWIKATAGTFEKVLEKLLVDRSWQQKGFEAKEWMLKYWGPKTLLRHYEAMYDDLMEKKA